MAAGREWQQGSDKRRGSNRNRHAALEAGCNRAVPAPAQQRCPAAGHASTQLPIPARTACAVLWLLRCGCSLQRPAPGSPQSKSTYQQVRKAEEGHEDEGTPQVQVIHVMPCQAEGQDAAGAAEDGGDVDAQLCRQAEGEQGMGAGRGGQWVGSGGGRVGESGGAAPPPLGTPVPSSILPACWSPSRCTPVPAIPCKTAGGAAPSSSGASSSNDP